MALPFFGIGMKVRNRFKGLDLIDRVPDEPWTEVHGSRIAEAWLAEFSALLY